MAARIAAALAIAASTWVPLCALGQSLPSSGATPPTDRTPPAATAWSSQPSSTTPTSAATPDARSDLPLPVFTRQTLFAIPFSLTPADSPDTTPIEVHLYVTADRGANWHLYAKENPASERFPFRASGDGEYWFATRTVDRLGRQRPEGAVAPELVVVVDTTPPQLELTATAGTAGEIQAAWRVVDDHLDAESFAVQYQAPLEPSWRPVALNYPRDGITRTNLVGQITWRPETASRVVQVRAEARDAAGNSSVTTRRVFLLRQSGPGPDAGGVATSGVSPQVPHERGDAPTFQQGERTSPYPWRGQGADRDPVATENSRGAIPTDPFASRNQGAAANSSPSPTGTNPHSTPWPADRYSSDPALSSDPAARGTSPSGASPALGGPSNPRDASNQGGVWTSGAPSNPRDSGGGGASNSGSDTWNYDRAPNGSQGAAPPRDRNVAGPVAPPADSGRYANPSYSPEGPALDGPSDAAGSASAGGVDPRRAEPRTALVPDDKPRFATPLRRFEVAYDVATTASVSRVELWGTSDGGRTWSRWATDPDRQSPVEISVDGPGTYGFRVIVENAVGLATRPPAPGDLPDVWVVVDETRPTAHILSAPFRVADGAGVLSISWEADDAHLDERPVTLLYSERPDGPWRTVAAALPNSGRYEWRIDPAIPPRIYLRLEVRDAAGNMAVDQLAQPVDIEHMVPSGHIRGVVP